MNPTDANTFALNLNTVTVIIVTLVSLILAVWGYKKYQGKNIIKSTVNKGGKITQSNGDNIIDDVDNESGTIVQK